MNKLISVQFTKDEDFITDLTSKRANTKQSETIVEYYTYYSEDERSYSDLYATMTKIFMFLEMAFFIVLIFTNYFP